MDYLDDLMLLPSNGSASLRDPCLHGDLSMMHEHDVDGLLDMYERDELSLDDPPVELPAPYSSVALSAFLCLDAQHATQAGALHTSTPHTPAITVPVCPSTATAQIPFTSISVAPAASCYAEPDAAHFITAAAFSPPAAPSNTMDCTAKHASKVRPGVGTPCKLADQELALAPTKIAKKCDKKPSKPVKAIVHGGKPVRKVCPLDGQDNGAQAGPPQLSLGRSLGEGAGDEDALCRGFQYCDCCRFDATGWHFY